MMTMNKPSNVRPGLLVIAVVAATLVVAGMIARLDPTASTMALHDALERQASQQPQLVVGVQANFKAGDTTIAAEFLELNLAIQPGAVLDGRLTTGAWEAEIIVTFWPGDVRAARLGAIVQEGSVIVIRDDRAIASDVANDVPRTILPIEPVRLTRKMQQVKYVFRTDGTHAIRLQAIWQPEGFSQPLELISNRPVQND